MDVQRCCGGREAFSIVSILASGSKPGVRSSSWRIDLIFHEVGQGFHMSLCITNKRRLSRFTIRTVGSLSVVQEPSRSESDPNLKISEVLRIQGSGDQGFLKIWEF